MSASKLEVGAGGKLVVHPDPQRLESRPGNGRFRQQAAIGLVESGDLARLYQRAAGVEDARHGLRVGRPHSRIVVRRPINARFRQEPVPLLFLRGNGRIGDVFREAHRVVGRSAGQPQRIEQLQLIVAIGRRSPEIRVQPRLRRERKCSHQVVGHLIAFRLVTHAQDHPLRLRLKYVLPLHGIEFRLILVGDVDGRGVGEIGPADELLVKRCRKNGIRQRIKLLHMPIENERVVAGSPLPMVADQNIGVFLRFLRQLRLDRAAQLGGIVVVILVDVPGGKPGFLELHENGVLRRQLLFDLDE